MSNELWNRRQAFYRALTECITQMTEVPIGLYELRDGATEVEEVIPETSRGHYEEHCNLIQRFPGGKQRCEADQRKRAKANIKSNRDRIRECCWAGVYNESVPIKINGKAVGMLVYGEMRFNEDDHRKQSLDRHRQAVSTLGLTPAQAKDLREALENVKTYSPQHFAKLENLVARAEQWMDAVVAEEKRARDIVERNTHEIMTRLQSVIAHAENLVSQIGSEDFQEAKKTAMSVLHSAESLDTVVQILDDYLEEYRFRRQSITSLIDEAIGLYEGEASRRQVDILTRIEGADSSAHWVDISARHLQYAINNLLHNAIKYSFKGGPNLYRYVEIAGQPEKNFYRLTFSNYGVGILPYEYEKVFRGNYQGKLTRGEYRTGSGKGLRFVKRTIESHHGKIEVESKLKAEQETPEGSPHVNRFTVRLPYHQPKGN
ncbi:MAG TPA: PocR ligand-binding domain-containing protein [Pyrinomonadaceae bacterium]|nr:PocR ligand-binding domain-containing protein [Pyrinomonadaceae bacterium]